MIELERFATGKAMQVYGGSFVAAIGAALQRADPINAERLRAAFPEFFEKYGAGSRFFAECARPYTPASKGRAFRAAERDPTSWPPL